MVMEREWTTPRQKPQKQPKKGSGRGDVGMELLAAALVAFPMAIGGALVAYLIFAR